MLRMFAAAERGAMRKRKEVDRVDRIRTRGPATAREGSD